MTAVCATSLQVDRIAGGWRAAPPITVVATPEDLPVLAPDDARGLLWDGQAWLVEENLEAATVASTLAHEVVAHHGLRESLGAAWLEFMAGIQTAVRRGDEELGYLRTDVRDVYGRMHPILEADEVAAAAVERWVDPETGRFEPASQVRKRAAAALGHFARETLFIDHPVSADQLEGALLAAQHHVTHGGPWFGIGTRLRHWYSSAMSIDHRGPAKPATSHEEMQDLLRGEREQRDWRLFWSALGGGGFTLVWAICALLSLAGLFGWLFGR